MNKLQANQDILLIENLKITTENQNNKIKDVNQDNFNQLEIQNKEYKFILTELNLNNIKLLEEVEELKKQNKNTDYSELEVTTEHIALENNTNNLYLSTKDKFLEIKLETIDLNLLDFQLELQNNHKTKISTLESEIDKHTSNYKHLEELCFGYKMTIKNLEYELNSSIEDNSSNHQIYESSIINNQKKIMDLENNIKLVQLNSDKIIKEKNIVIEDQLKSISKIEHDVNKIQDILDGTTISKDIELNKILIEFEKERNGRELLYIKNINLKKLFEDLKIDNTDLLTRLDFLECEKQQTEFQNQNIHESLNKDNAELNKENSQLRTSNKIMNEELEILKQKIIDCETDITRLTLKTNQNSSLSNPENLTKNQNSIQYNLEEEIKEQIIIIEKQSATILQIKQELNFLQDKFQKMECLNKEETGKLLKEFKEEREGRDRIYLKNVELKKVAEDLMIENSNLVSDINTFENKQQYKELSNHLLSEKTSEIYNQDIIKLNKIKGEYENENLQLRETNKIQKELMNNLQQELIACNENINYLRCYFDINQFIFEKVVSNEL